MRIVRAMDLVHTLLSASVHPDIESVTYYDEVGVNSPAGIQVNMTDGTNVRLRVVGGCGPGGDNFSQPEHIPYPDYQTPEEVNENVPSLRTIRRR
mgnify:FL=1